MRMSQNNRGVLFGVLAIGALFLLGNRQRNAQGSLSGFNISVEQGPPVATMGHLIGRTVSASGEVTNTGNIDATYRVRLAAPFDVLDSEEVTLAPGQSAGISLSGQRDVEDGDSFTPRVFLDLVEPESDTAIDIINGDTWTESHAHQATGSLSGWSVDVSQRRVLRRL